MMKLIFLLAVGGSSFPKAVTLVSVFFSKAKKIKWNCFLKNASNVI